jgi:carbamoylphosphate synthase small subunit
MKVSQLLNEDANYKAQLKNDVNAYLVRLKANGIPQIDTDILVRELNDMGHSVTPEAVVDLLTNSKYTSKASVDEIVVAGAPSAKAADADAEKNRKAVKNLAKKATTKRIN